MKFGFYSCMSGMPWGGSEVLWYKAAKKLQRMDHEVCVNFKWWPYKAFQLEDLEKHGAHPVSYTHLTLPTILLV